MDPSGKISEEEKTAYETGLLSKDVYDILVNLGKRYNEAKTKEAKEEIHNLAEKFRNNNCE